MHNSYVSNVRLETDAKIMVDAIQANSDDQSKFDQVVDDYRHFFHQTTDWSLIWIQRQALVVHSFNKIAILHASSIVWLEPPYSLCSVLEFDVSPNFFT